METRTTTLDAVATRIERKAENITDRRWLVERVRTGEAEVRKAALELLDIADFAGGAARRIRSIAYDLNAWLDGPR